MEGNRQMERIAAFPTEIEFTLPRGFIDAAGVVHRRGKMRLATAADEILPQRDPRVQSNPAYLTVIILARVVTRLGALPDVDTQTIENLFTADLEHLRRLYEDINALDVADDAAPVPANGHAAPAGGLRVLGEV